MKCLIIGYGSIGEKYANILVDLGVNVYIHDLKKKLVLTKVNVIKNLHAIEQNFFSLIIICTPSQDHFETFQIIKEKSLNILIEKPISNRIHESEMILAEKKKIRSNIFVVSNMRFHPGIEFLRNKIKYIGNIQNVYSHFGSKLPEKRIQNKNSYIYKSHSRGGGITIDLIHEFDYLAYLFGKIKIFSGLSEYLTINNLKFENRSSYLLKSNENFPIFLHLNFFQELKTRGCKILGSNGILEWQSYKKDPEFISLSFYHKKKKIEKKMIKASVDVSYIEMLRSILCFVKTGKVDERLSDVQQGLEALILAKNNFKNSKKIR